MDNYLNKDCCLNCNNFTFWDGDFVCVYNMKILQSCNNNYYINSDLDKTIKTKDKCKDWEICNYLINNIYINEYKKYKELEKLEIELEKFVK